ncbi:LuxR C-terminal-related transcriptional regulator [Azospirillum thiophilum]|uniref:LuxR C-terminal-related transcriptional regulator n=1 Tax=Azospirillum thiophilum TaxID=528244 RepID=UPI000696C588|nr:LuxR C-terminal-related transcriptional regulator [Azospirillum thiophilum]
MLMSCIEPTLPPASPVGMALKAEVGSSHCRGRDMVARLTQLTAREVDVLVRLVAGKSSKTIGLDLGISFKTVECHRAHIMQKLGCSGLFELGRAWEAAVWSSREKKAMR